MAYLDYVVKGLKEHIFEFHKERDDTSEIGQTWEAYTERMHPLVKKAAPFVNIKDQLMNIFADKPKDIDAAARKDLLNLSSEGNQRMRSYLRQFILKPPVEKLSKTRRRKCRTLTKPKTTQRSQNLRQHSVPKLQD